VVLGVELNGLGEVLDGFWIAFGFEGFIAFVFEFVG